MTDMISRADAIAAIRKQIGYRDEPWMNGNNSAIAACVATIRALPAAQVSDPAKIRDAALREAADMLARQGYGTAVRQILALIPTPPAVSDDVAAQKRQQAAQTLWDLLHMKNGAHDGMTIGDVHALWDDVKEEAGYAAVTAFLANLKGGA